MGGGGPADLVLSPADIRAAERLLEGRPRNADPPPQELADFLDASRARREEETRRLRRTTGRAFVKPAEEALREGRGEHAVRLCAAGALLAGDLDFDPKVDTRLRGPAVKAILESRTRAVLKAHRKAVTVAAFSPDGLRIVTASSDKTARIWDAATGKQIAPLEGHTSLVNSAAFSPDGQRVVSASWDNSARIWDAATGQQITALQGHKNWVLTAAFSPDGQRIVAASGGNSTRIWDAATGKEIAALQGHTDIVRSAAFSPDGARMVTASYDKTARIWDAATGKQIAALEGHTDRVLSAAFSPDGQRIVTASDDNSARIWDVSRSAAIVRSPSIALTAALAGGVGECTAPEHSDLLMQDAAEQFNGDLYAEARRQLLDPQKYPPEEIARREALLEQTIADLRAPLHPNCYLSPTQFAEKFGLPPPAAAEAAPPPPPVILPQRPRLRSPQPRKRRPKAAMRRPKAAEGERAPVLAARKRALLRPPLPPTDSRYRRCHCW